MCTKPIARIKKASYENIVAKCPWCGKMNIFNRASDLGTFEPISGRCVSCQSDDCGKSFRIIGDRVNCKHEMLIIDCYELLEKKHYMNCILNLSLAYEMFFSLFMRVMLVYKPFVFETNRDIHQLNQLMNMLRKKLNNYAFDKMRNLFLNQIISGSQPANLLEAEREIKSLDERLNTPKDLEIDGIIDRQLVAVLKAIKKTAINRIRNRVIHKEAYRPTRKEAERAIEETRSLLFPLTDYFDLHDDINWYMRKL